MIVCETILAVTMVCTAAGTARDESLPEFLSGGLAKNFFQISSGSSLEEQVKRDIEQLEGVHSVQITKGNGRIAVNVFLTELDFRYFPALAAKEIELFDSYPGLKFDFNMLPIAAIEEPQLALYAA